MDFPTRSSGPCSTVSWRCSGGEKRGEERADPTSLPLADHPGEMSFDETDWLAYRQANLLFAEAVKDVVNSGDIVWVQGPSSLPPFPRSR